MIRSRISFTGKHCVYSRAFYFNSFERIYWVLSLLSLCTVAVVVVIVVFVVVVFGAVIVVVVVYLFICALFNVGCML